MHPLRRFTFFERLFGHFRFRQVTQPIPKDRPIDDGEPQQRHRCDDSTGGGSCPDPWSFAGSAPSVETRDRPQQPQNAPPSSLSGACMNNDRIAIHLDYLADALHNLAQELRRPPSPRLPTDPPDDGFGEGEKQQRHQQDDGTGG